MHLAFMHLYSIIYTIMRFRRQQETPLTFEIGEPLPQVWGRSIFTPNDDKPFITPLDQGELSEPIEISGSLITEIMPDLTETDRPIEPFDAVCYVLESKGARIIDPSEQDDSRTQLVRAVADHIANPSLSRLNWMRFETNGLLSIGEERQGIETAPMILKRNEVSTAERPLALKWLISTDFVPHTKSDSSPRKTESSEQTAQTEPTQRNKPVSLSKIAIKTLEKLDTKGRLEVFHAIGMLATRKNQR